jgi:DNA-directed RNA polymerase specialized sigma24 family protein
VGAALSREAGYSEAEIAETLGVTVRTVHRDRRAMEEALIAVLRDDGYSAREAALTLGVSEARVRSAALGSTLPVGTRARSDDARHPADRELPAERRRRGRIRAA